MWKAPALSVTTSMLQKHGTVSMTPSWYAETATGRPGKYFAARTVYADDGDDVDRRPRDPHYALPLLRGCHCPRGMALRKMQRRGKAESLMGSRIGMLPALTRALARNCCARGECRWWSVKGEGGNPGAGGLQKGGQGRAGGWRMRPPVVQRDGHRNGGDDGWGSDASSNRQHSISGDPGLCPVAGDLVKSRSPSRPCRMGNGAERPAPRRLASCPSHQVPPTLR